MKANSVPRADRLRRRILGLEMLYEQSRDKMDKIHGGRGNPYYGCVGCGRAEPHISVHGHDSWCRFKSLKGEIAYYKRELEEESKKP